MGLDNRQLAALIGLGIFALAVLSNRRTRESLLSLGVSVAKVSGPLVAMGAYALGLVLLAREIHLWDQRLLTETILWIGVTGPALLYGVATRDKKKHIFRRTAAQALGVTVFLEVVIGLFVFDLLVELLLLVVLTVLVLFSAVASRHSETQRLGSQANLLLSLLGFGLLAYSTFQLIDQWQALDKAHLGRAMVLPASLTLGMMPFLYGIALWTGYEWAFKSINDEANGGKTKLRAKLGLLLALRLRVDRARAFTTYWSRKLVHATSIGEARAVGFAFLEDERRKEREAEADEQRLRDYAGVKGTGEDGRRLDQREFAPTKKALIHLGTAQMNWYRQWGRYRPDLLRLLSPFRGLPENHGVNLSVSRDGQSWCAGRRTISGWCFAIGAAGPPPNQWLYDGPDLPSGFPGKDPSWGEDQWDAPADNW